MRCRVVRGAGGNGERWDAPVLGSGAGNPGERLPEFTVPAAEDTAAQAEQAREAGYARGYAEGLDAAREESAARLALLGELVKTLRQPLADLDEQVDTELARLALTIAQQILRREIDTDPQQIVAVVREARGVLRDVQGVLRIAVHPEEAQAVRGMFSDIDALDEVRVDEDPSIARGGCVLDTDVSRVDARVETRVAQIAAQLLGDARAHGGAG